jgi:hypothetical protein
MNLARISDKEDTALFEMRQDQRSEFPLEYNNVTDQVVYPSLGYNLLGSSLLFLR